MSGEVEHRRKRLVFAGITTLDLVHRAERLPEPGSKQEAESSYFDVGGPAANAAITASILGAVVRLHTVVGTGPLPEYAAAVLGGHRIEIQDHAGPGASLSVASIWVAGSGERTILSTGNVLGEVDIKNGPLLPADTAAVLIDGHYPKIARAVAAAAVKAEIPIVLDCGRWRPIYAELLPLATDIIMCETFRPPDITEVTAEQAVAAIHERWRPELCAMTRGSDDVLAVTDRGLVANSVPRVDAIDTMGAGDVLHGVYVYERYVAARPSSAALQRAVAVASSSCRFLGTRRGVLEAANPRD